jgi:hypothetical protein
MVSGADESTQAIMDLLDLFFDALNARDVTRLAGACNFPQVRLASGTMTIWRTAGEFEQSGDLAGIPFEREWHHSAWKRRHIIQSSHDKCHVAVTFTRYRSNGDEISTFKSLYIVTKQNGHWGVQIRSSFAP